MPSLIPLLLAHPDLPAPVLASLKIVADSRDPYARARARQVASSGLQVAYDLTEAEVADLIADLEPPGEFQTSRDGTPAAKPPPSRRDPGQASAASGGCGGSPRPRRTSPSSARAQNT
jgi:hypothetical protein